MEVKIKDMTVERRRQVGMALMLLVGAVGIVLQWHDTPLLVAIVAAVGMLWAGRQRGALVFVAVLLGAGLFWSSLDGHHCSLWWKGKVVYARLTGGAPYVTWDGVKNAVFSRCYYYHKPPSHLDDAVKQIKEKTFNERKLELYRTGLGDFWISAPGEKVIKLLIWEMVMQSAYEGPGVAIRKGDIVIDCGAHVGVFTRLALRRGADRVIAIEPDPTNIACLRENLAEEIAGGKVTVVEKGVWDLKIRLPLSIHETNSAAHTFAFESDDPNAETVAGIEVLPLDHIVQELQLDRVDFIKMDIEGSEQPALKGAVDTIAQFKPRLAVCSYHVQGDPEAILAIVQEARSDYRIHAEGVDMRWGTVNPRTLFFN